MTNKLKQARHSGLGLTLPAGEVRLMASVCHSVLTLKAPRTAEEDLDILSVLKSRAVTAGRQNVGMELDKGEVELITFCLGRASVYACDIAPYDVLGTWLSVYFEPPVNHCHRLDYKRDLSEDYSLGLELNQKDMSTKLRGMTGEEIEDYAEIIFFCVVSLVEKLEEARACGNGMDIKAREASALMTVKVNLRPADSEGSEKVEPSTVCNFSEHFISLFGHIREFYVFLMCPELWDIKKSAKD